jgi:Flp pilus assembly protein CpaB
MNRRRIGLALIVAGIVLAGLIGFLVYQQADAAEQLRAAQPKNWGVVSLVDIPERTAIQAEQLDVIRVPDAALPQTGTAVYRPLPNTSEQQIEAGKAAAKQSVVGQFTGEKIYKGEVINTERLGQPAAQARPALQIPQGMVWYHLPIGAGAGGAGQALITALNFVRPGDSIDIYFTSTETAPVVGAASTNPTADSLRGLFTRKILQNVKIINVGPFPAGAPPAPGERLLTVEIKEEDAPKLKWLKDAAGVLGGAGNMEFVVRSPQDADAPIPAPTVNFDMISQLTGIGTGQ